MKKVLAIILTIVTLSCTLGVQTTCFADEPTQHFSIVEKIQSKIAKIRKNVISALSSNSFLDEHIDTFKGITGIALALTTFSIFFIIGSIPHQCEWPHTNCRLDELYNAYNWLKNFNPSQINKIYHECCSNSSSYDHCKELLDVRSCSLKCY